MHVITGHIRKAPFVKDGSNANGAWRMYAVELSESYKNWEGARDYTNYRITFFAKESLMAWYDDAFQEGKIISVTGESIAVNQREHNGKNYITLEINNPRLEFSQRGDSAPQQQQLQQQQRQQQPQQQQQRQPEKQQQFDNDIPF